MSDSAGEEGLCVASADHHFHLGAVFDIISVGN
jgi:hypothetical protein